MDFGIILISFFSGVISGIALVIVPVVQLTKQVIKVDLIGYILFVVLLIIVIFSGFSFGLWLILVG